MSTVESPHRFDAMRLFVVMGVAGCGKSSVGAAVADRLGAHMGTVLNAAVYRIP